MNNKKLKLLKQLHQTYGNKIDASLLSKSYQRTCHVFNIKHLRKQFKQSK